MISQVRAAADANREADVTKGAGLADLGISGERLLTLLERPMVTEVSAGVPTRGHLSLLVAPPFTGKTTLSLWNAMARAAGVEPWAGAPMPEAGRVLLLSPDEAAAQVALRMHQLSKFHPAGPLEGYVNNLVVIGPDAEVPIEDLNRLRLDSEGLDGLESYLERERLRGRPFLELHIDAYADILPLTASENSNEDATRVGGALERLAVTYDVAITLLHHTAKPRPDESRDLVNLARGASALTAKARVITSLENVRGKPHLRHIRTLTNLGEAREPLTLEVCPREDTRAGEERLLYFQRSEGLPESGLEELLKPGESITTTNLACRIAGIGEDKKPPGDARREATDLRNEWNRRDLIDVVAGPRGAKMIRLREKPDEPAKAEQSTDPNRATD